MKENYRPVSIVSVLSKYFKSVCLDEYFIILNKFLTNNIVNFIRAIIHKNVWKCWKKKQISVDKDRVFGALLTGQSKAFGVLDMYSSLYFVQYTLYFAKKILMS